MDAYLDCGARVHDPQSALHLADDLSRMLSQLHHTGEMYNTKTTYKQTTTVIKRCQTVYRTTISTLNSTAELRFMDARALCTSPTILSECRRSRITRARCTIPRQPINRQQLSSNDVKQYIEQVYGRLPRLWSSGS